MIDRQIRVVKVGGSLLELPDLAERLRRWLGLQPPMSNALLIGGGQMANAVRELDRLHRLGEESAHWLAVRAMQLNAQLAGALLPEASWPRSAVELVEDAAELVEDAATLSIVDPWRLLCDEDARQSPRPLPASWQVTSDSIAARLAHLCGARELVLLKSALPDSDTLSAAAAAGYVDGFFQQAAMGLRLRCVNLRGCVNLQDGQFPEIELCGFDRF